MPTAELNASNAKLKPARRKQPPGNATIVRRQRPTMPEYLTLASLDGRTKPSRLAYELFEQFAAQHGLKPPDYGKKKDLLEQAAYLGVRMQDMIARGLKGEPTDDALFSLMTNAQRRILRSL